MNLIEIIRDIGDWIDALGVAVVSLGVLWGLACFARDLMCQSTGVAYKTFQIQIVRSLLLGLEILVASDVIRTVAMNPTFSGITLLGAIVLIRCFLSWSLIMETEGRWPWQPPRDKEPDAVD